MNQKRVFYGTPLNRSIKDNNYDNDLTSFSGAKRRYEDKTVRDEQGRQRFHGAFTGGFSAGYYNTVGTVQGFQPKQYSISKHDKSRTYGASRFSHKPEDYMDEEDLAEFGIAPQKVRINNQFAANDHHARDDFRFAGIDLLVPKSSQRSIPQSSVSASMADLFETNKSMPIGEQIPNKMLRPSSKKNFEPNNALDYQIIQNYINTDKQDYHGLGYKPLKKHDSVGANFRSDNPLLARMKDGKRIKISGEAFGSGVLDDDDDYLVEADYAWAFDDIKDYNNSFSATKGESSKRKRSLDKLNNNQDELYEFSQLKGYLPGFVLTKADNLDSDSPSRPPEVVIPSDWKLPVRKVEPADQSAKISLKFIPNQSGFAASDFADKFASGVKLQSLDSSDIKHGLLKYSDLKDVARKISKKLAEDSDEHASRAKVTITRNVVHWYPCSLLCKRFNVPNPHPDRNASLPIKSSVTNSSELQSDLAEVIHPSEPKVSLDRLRSIFNIDFFGSDFDDDCIQEVQKHVMTPKLSSRPPIQECEINNRPYVESDENAPVYVVIEEKLPCSKRDLISDDDSDEDQQDVEVVPINNQEPEVIEIGSSSSCSSSSLHHLIPSKNEEEKDGDSYGPPLPPMMQSRLNYSSKRKTKKRHKHKHKHHRRKDKR